MTFVNILLLVAYKLTNIAICLIIGIKDMRDNPQELLIIMWKRGCNLFITMAV